MNKQNFYPSILILIALFLSGCGGGSGSSSSNTAPVAVAGTDDNVITGVFVVLDGGESSDADGDTLSYQWTLQTKPVGSLSELFASTVVNPYFTPDVDGSYTVSLVVNDGEVNSIADTVTFTASSTMNNAPIANAGTDKSVQTGLVVLLNGSASYDSDGHTISYQWALQSKPAGSLSVLFSSTLVSPSITPDVDGSYTISLVVNDGIVDSSADTMLVIATATGPVGSITAGAEKYDLSCASCHKAGTYDPVGGDSDLYDDGERVINAISSISGMNSVTDLTDQEVLDLKVFLESPSTNAP